ncbi:acetyltransferase [uncultured Algimonas sp.]|uniref:acetyltransferase n=1 Tax=uncultured Algimonas sp. TaxID=1547920 RepID=UPI002605D113|nr:acetyltransferase [uncultured Algimonas sp.]
MSPVVILGAGGHARVLADVLKRSGNAALGFIDRDPGAPGVVGTDAQLGSLADTHQDLHFIVGVGSVRGGHGLREKLWTMALEAGLEPMSAVHPAAILAGDVTLGAGTVVMAGAILNPGVCTGVNVIVNTGAVLDHDVKLGDHVHVAPGCTLSGGVEIGDHSLLGTATVARQSARVGSNVTIGAGSLLLGDYADDRTYFGRPAKAWD